KSGTGPTKFGLWFHRMNAGFEGQATCFPVEWCPFFYFSVNHRFGNIFLPFGPFCYVGERLPYDVNWSFNGNLIPGLHRCLDVDWDIHDVRELTYYDLSK